MRIIKKALLWLFRELFSMYAPLAFIIIFALAQEYFFPDSPIWPTDLFALFTIYIFARYVKW